MAKKHKLIGKYVQINAESYAHYSWYGLLVDYDDTLMFPFLVLLENGEQHTFKHTSFSTVKKSETPVHLSFIGKITNEMGGVINWRKKMLYIGCQKISLKKVHSLSSLISLLAQKRK